MGLVTLAIFSGGIESLTASIFLMFAHGLVLSALFIMLFYRIREQGDSGWPSTVHLRTDDVT